MKQAFKLKKEEYHKATKQMLFRSFMFILSFILIILGVFYFTNSNFPKIFTWESAYFILIPICLPILIQICIDLYKLKTKYKSYKVIFDDDAILFEQLGYWQEPFFFGSNYSISKRRIRYKEITEIRKSKMGYYTIKGEENSYPNTILISLELENIEAFEIALSEIKPIISTDEANDLETYTFGKVAIEKQKRQFFNVKTISIFLGIYLMALLISYFWFYPINWPLTIFLSSISLLAIFVVPYFYYNSSHRLFSIFTDKTAIISERERGNPKAISFNEITSIKINSYSLIIIGKKLSFAGDNVIIIPNTFKNMDNLEQKLNTIHPIVYTKKNRNSALTSDD